MKAATARINALGTRIFGGTNPYLLMSLPALIVMLALFTITALCARIASALAARNIGRWKEYSGNSGQSHVPRPRRPGRPHGVRSIPCTTASTTRTPTRRTSGGGGELIPQTQPQQEIQPPGGINPDQGEDISTGH